MTVRSIQDAGEPTLEKMSLYSIAELIDDLTSDDPKVCLNSVKNLSTIALSLGTERTREELIPFLSEVITNDHDEVLLALAELLGNFTDYVGGPEFAYTLLAPLKALATAEQTGIRIKSIESLCHIAALLSQEDLEHFFVPLVINMTKEEWFTSQIAACGLYSVCYSRVSPMIKSELLNHFSKLCLEGASMVKKAAATHLGELAKIVELDSLKNDLIPIFNALIYDKYDTVRLSALEAYINIGSLFPYEYLNNAVMPIIRLCITEKFWRIRYVIADKIIEKSVGPEITRTDLVPAFLSLLLDDEPEVKVVAASKLCDFCHNLCHPTASSNDAPISDVIDSIIVISILPVVKRSFDDSNEDVKSAIASVIMGLSPILGRQRTIDYLLPLFLSQLSNHCPEVRLNIITNLNFVHEVIGIQLFSEKLLPPIFELSSDSNWRTRLAVIKCLPLLASKLGVKFFNEKLNGLCMKLLIDPVFAVRESAILNLKKLVEIFGLEWAQMSILPNMTSLATNPKYLHRLTFLFCVNELADVCSLETIDETLIPMIILMANDSVANVRFNVAKTLQKIGPICVQNKKMKSKMKLILNELINDTDVDVKYFAAEAMTMIPWN